MNTKKWIPLLAGLAFNSGNAAKIVHSMSEATITVPSEGDALMGKEAIFLRGTVSDNNHANDELTASWYSGGGSSYATTNERGVPHIQSVNFGSGQIIISL